MFCRKCGKKLELHDKFCNNCGEPVILETVGETTIVPEPPKDLVWNVEGFPKDKKVEDIIFDWKIGSQGEDFVVDDFYINENKNVSAQKLLDQELEKINRNNIAREQAIIAARAIAEVQEVNTTQTVSNARRMFSEEIKSDLEGIVKIRDKNGSAIVPEVQSEPEPASEPDSASASEPDAASDSAPTPDSAPTTDSDPTPDPDPDPTTESDPDPTTDSDSDPTPDSDPDPTTDADPTTDSDSAPTTDSDPTPDPAPDPTTDPDPDPTTESDPINIETMNVPNKTELKYDDIFVEEEEEPKRKGFTFGKFLLLLLIVLIILEGVFLGFKYYMPDNTYFKIVDEKVTKAVLTVESWFEVEDLEVETPKVEEPAAEEPVAEQIAIEEPVNPFPENKNIVEISMNPQLVYVPGKEYGIGDINQSLPAQENGEQVIKTIVEYNSKWIDYVNTGDKSVLALTAPGSQAEKNALNFTKVGKIKETFTLLEIGEVRKGAKGYYIWVREEIEILENNLTSTKVYNWIYQLTPVESQMKIVNYFSYK